MAALRSACTVARRSRAAAVDTSVHSGRTCPPEHGNGGKLVLLKKIAVTLAVLLLLQPSGLVFAV
jgi:hypothetical protein